MTLPDHLKGALVGYGVLSAPMKNHEALILHTDSPLRGQMPIENIWPQLTEEDHNVLIQASLLLHPEREIDTRWVVNGRRVVTWGNDSEVWVEVENAEKMVYPKGRSFT